MQTPPPTDELDNAPAPKAKADFLRAVQRNSQSAVALYFVRTREPIRVRDTLLEHALMNGRPFCEWSAAQGNLTSYDLAGTPTAKPMPPLAALKGIGASPAGTIHLFSDLHPLLGANPNGQPVQDVVALLREYAWDLPSKPRIACAVCVPETFSVPAELAHCIPVVEFALPDAQELTDTIARIFSDDAAARGAVPQSYTADEMRRLGISAQGMTLLETESAASGVLVDHKQALPHIPFDVFNRALMEAKSEIVKASGFLELMPPVDIANVGGLDVLKAWLDARRMDMLPEAEESGVKRPRGLTVIGPPGTGKSLTAGTVAAAFGLPGVKLHFDALLGGLVGQSEANLRRVLNDIKALGACVVFADEIDRTFGMNGGVNDGGVNKRMIGKLLDFMQSNQSGAFFVFAANRAEGIDSALIRKGRIDEVFAVLPPNRRERLEILRIHLRKAKRDPEQVEGLETAADASEGYVGAEIESAVQRAASLSFRTKTPITGAMIAKEVKSIRPLAEAFAEDFRSMKEWAEQNAIAASTPDTSEARKQVRSKAEPAPASLRRRTLN